MKVAVVAHTSRQEMAENLAEETDAELFMDDGRFGEWNNHARAWQWLAENTDYGVVIQDDVIPIKNFSAEARQATEVRPDAAIGFYMGKAAPAVVQPSLAYALRQAKEKRVSWIQTRKIIWGPAIGIPTRHVPKMLADYDGKTLYDTFVGGWLNRNKVPQVYTYPSLVDHRDGPTTLAKDAPTGRVAHIVGPQTNPYDLRSVSFWM